MKERNENLHSGRSNRDPITGAPGAHPVGVGVGGVAGGMAAGAAVGTVLGPIGTLIGAATGVVAGAEVGRRMAERLDIAGEEAYWREAYRDRPYVKAGHDYDHDYAPAYRMGVQARDADLERDWDESGLREEWNRNKGGSRLSWDEAREAVRDAWDRAARTHEAYARTDAHFADAFPRAGYQDEGARFEDYLPAYRYGAYARSRHADRPWDDALEAELARDWSLRRGKSPLEWDRAKAAVQHAYLAHGEYSSGSYTGDAGGPDDRSRFRVG